MGERVTPASANRKHLVPSGEILVSPVIINRTQIEGTVYTPIFEPGQTVYLTEYIRRINTNEATVQLIAKKFESLGRIKPGEGLKPTILFTEGTAAEQSEGIAQVAALVSKDAGFYALVGPEETQDPSEQFPPSKKKARQMVTDFVATQSELLFTTNEPNLKVDQITEMSTAEVISALWERKKEIARSDDPVDLRLDRMAVIQMAEAVLTYQEIHLPDHAVALFSAYATDVLEPGAAYTRYKIRSETKMGENEVQRGLDGMRQVGMVTTSQRLVAGGVYLNEHTFSSKYVDASQNQLQSEQNDLNPGATLLNKLLGDVISHESTTLEGAYKRAAAAHMLEAALQNGLFDSHAATESLPEYTSLLLKGSHGDALASIFVFIENGDIDISQVHPRNYLYQNFPEHFANEYRVDAVRTILESVGLMKFESAGKRSPKPAKQTTSQIDEHPGTEVSTDELVQRLIDGGEKDKRMLAAIANIKEGEADLYLKRARKQKTEAAQRGEMQEGQQLVLVNNTIGTVVSERGNQYVRTVEDGITIIRPAA